MMKIALILALLAVTHVFAQTCKSPLATNLAIDNKDTPSAETDSFTYCKSLQGQDTCCTAATINGFQAKAEALVETVRTAVAARDVFLVDTRKNFIPDIANLLVELRDGAEAAVNKLTTDSASEDDIAVVQALEDEAELVTTGLSSLVSSLSTYQRSRSTCVVEIINLQAAAWCLACDPTWASQGVDDVSGAITLAASVNTRLATACYAFLSNSAEQNLILHFRYLSNKLQSYIDALTAITTSGDSAVAALEALINSQTDVTTPANDNETPVEKTLPDDCTSTDCPLITEQLWNAETAQVDTTVLAAGGPLATLGDGSSEEEEAEAETETSGTGRRLATTGEWEPAADEAGISITFPTNPGNVDNSAQLIKGALACALMFAMALFI